MHILPKTTALAALASLAACGSPKEDAAPVGTASATAAAAAAYPEMAANAPASFAQCKACHAVEPGKHGIGPSLHGVYGTKAGEIAGFSFSPALKASGLTWDDATLDKWLTSPMTLVPGTRMSYAGMSDPAKRAELVAYIKSLK
jgi:cytochrome c